MSRPSAKVRQLDIEKTGTMSVPVFPPTTDKPEGLVSMYTYADQKPHFTHKSPASQLIDVEYAIYSDPVQLADLAERSRGNKSGTAVRGTCHAANGRVTSKGLDDRTIGNLVKRAANNDNGRAIDGPIRASVKLLSRPTPMPETCGRCRRPAAQHVREELPRMGDWGEWEPDPSSVRNHQTRKWDPDKPRIDLRWWCPAPSDQGQVSA